MTFAQARTGLHVPIVVAKYRPYKPFTDAPGFLPRPDLRYSVLGRPFNLSKRFIRRLRPLASVKDGRQRTPISFPPIPRFKSHEDDVLDDLTPRVCQLLFG